MLGLQPSCFWFDTHMHIKHTHTHLTEKTAYSQNHTPFLLIHERCKIGQNNHINNPAETFMHVHTHSPSLSHTHSRTERCSLSSTTSLLILGCLLSICVCVFPCVFLLCDDRGYWQAKPASYRMSSLNDSVVKHYRGPSGGETPCQGLC